MPVAVAICRIGNRAVRHLVADSLAELEALGGLHAGLPAYVTGTSEAYQWNGAAWVLGGGGSVGPEVASSGVTVRAGSCGVLYDFGT